MEAELLLILKRRHPRHGFELAMECRLAHICRNGQICHVDCLTQLVSKSLNGLDNPLIVAVRRDHHLAYPTAFGPCQKPVTYLTHDPWIERRYSLWSFEKTNCVLRTIYELTIELENECATGFRFAGCSEHHLDLFRDLLHDGEVQFDFKSEIRLF